MKDLTGTRCAPARAARGSIPLRPCGRPEDRQSEVPLHARGSRDAAGAETERVVDELHASLELERRALAEEVLTPPRPDTPSCCSESPNAWPLSFRRSEWTLSPPPANGCHSPRSQL